MGSARNPRGGHDEKTRHSCDSVSCCRLRERLGQSFDQRVSEARRPYARRLSGGPEGREGTRRPKGQSLKNAAATEAAEALRLWSELAIGPRQVGARGVCGRSGLGPATGGHPARYRPHGERDIGGRMATRLPLVRSRLQPAGDHARGQRGDPRDRRHVRPSQEGRLRQKVFSRRGSLKKPASWSRKYWRLGMASCWLRFPTRRAARPTRRPCRSFLSRSMTWPELPAAAWR
ncbi:MAG: hypothetical protein MZV63_65740 [Marinilabiliales bacterium]|nr:hypothetical protein [Marinilabiliales bacterium]